MVSVGNTASMCWHNLEAIEMLWRQEIVTGKKFFLALHLKVPKK
jgi:hypothetical protein